MYWQEDMDMRYIKSELNSFNRENTMETQSVIVYRSQTEKNMDLFIQEYPIVPLVCLGLIAAGILLTLAQSLWDSVKRWQWNRKRGF